MKINMLNILYFFKLSFLYQFDVLTVEIMSFCLFPGNGHSLSEYQNLDISQTFIIFIYKLQDYSDFLDEKCGTTDFYGELVDVFVGAVLGQALECSIGVHKFTQNLKTLQNGGYNKEPKNDWTKVDEKFGAELQKFWMSANIVWHPLLMV
jgi:hypothetical protein